MYVGELAKRTGASPKALRLYETLGLLGEAQEKDLIVFSRKRMFSKSY